MAAWRTLGCLLVTLAGTGAAPAQTYSLKEPNLAGSSQPDFRQAGFIVEVLFWPAAHNSAVGVSLDLARP